MFRSDPGPCPICGAAHTTCSADSGPIAITQLPSRDAAARASAALPLGTVAAPAAEATAVHSAPLVADVVQAGLPPGAFTTGTYHGKRKR